MIEQDRRIPAIVGMGKAWGKQVITNADIEMLMPGRRPGALTRISNSVGIQERHWVEAGVATSDLCVEALTEALEDAGIAPDELKALWIATSSPDYLGVSMPSLVQSKMGLPHSLGGSTNHDACPGWLLATQRAVIDLTSPYGFGPPQAVIGAEVISSSISMKKTAVSFLFGDAAGAVVFDLVEPDEDAFTNMAFINGFDGKYAENLYIKAGGSKKRTSHETVEDDEHTLDMDGPIIKEQAVRRMGEALESAVEKAGTTLERLDLIIPHQANLQIITALANNYEISMGKVIVTIDKYGNTSSASIPTAMYEAYHEGKLKRNDLVGTASFGAGLVYAAAVLPMVGLHRQ